MKYLKIVDNIRHKELPPVLENSRSLGVSDYENGGFELPTRESLGLYGWRSDRRWFYGYYELIRLIRRL